MNYRNFICVFLLLLAFGTGSGWAITILVQDFEQVVKESPLIVEVVVKDVELYIIPNSALGYATITLSVQDVIKGTCPSQILIRRYGINERHEYLDTEYVPVYFTQKRYIICLKKHPNGYYKPLGLFNGTFAIENGVVTGRGVSVDDFKQQINNILDGLKGDSSAQPLKRHKGVSVLKMDNSSNVIASAGSHMGGQFVTFDETWKTSYLQ